MHKALMVLDMNQREVVILKSYHSFNYNEIANMTGLSVPAVRSLLYKARIKLREEYNRLKSEVI